MVGINLSNLTLSSATAEMLPAAQAVTKSGGNTAILSSPQNNGGDSVTISGHAMLLSRLFHTDDPNAKPEVLTSFTTNNLSGNSYSFLKQEDRKLIERAYEYATANGVDPLQVDNLAFDLANYRFLQVTGNNTGETTGIYDTEGKPWVGEFNAQDAE